MWSIVASMSIIMEGYDWGLQGNLWGMIEYRKVRLASARTRLGSLLTLQTFGTYYPDLDDWQPTGAWMVSSFIS